MMERNVKKLSLLLIFVLVFTLSACNSSAPATSAEYTFEGSLAFNSEDKQFEVLYNDIFKMESVTRTIKGVTSSGEEVTNEVKGVLLETILSENEIAQKDLSTIRFIAGDGYAIDVPADIVTEKEIILAYEFNGEPLSEKKQPLRVAIDDVRTMYYVSNLVKIDLCPSEEGVSNSNDSSKVQKVVLLETTANHSTLHDYTYYESNDHALKVSELFTEYEIDIKGSANFVAADGFEKTEQNEVLDGGFFKVTGDNRPLFLSPDLPKGMHVKQFVTLTCDTVVFMSAEQGISILPSREIDGQTGAKLEAFVELSGLEGEVYHFVAADGYAAEVSKEDLTYGIVYIDDKGRVRTKFANTMPKSSGVKDILTIEVVEKADTLTSNDSSSTEGSVLTTSWTIKFNGLSDGSFEFTNEKAARKLELVEIETKYIKNDKEVVDTWQGYKVLDVLNFLKVSEYNSLSFASADGFEVELTKDEVDEETILAVVKNGQEMTDPSNLVRLVQNTEFATKWIKGVVEVTVK